MQHAANLAESALPIADHHAPAVTQPQPAAKPSATVLDGFWRRMLAMYGHAWASQNGDHAAGITAETWASCLVGITPEQIAAGLRACLAEGAEFPPSAPRFRAMCVGIPGLAEVRYRIRQGEATPFTRLVWQSIDGYRYRQASSDVADRMLRDAYELAREHVMRGNPLPEGSRELECDEPTPAKPASPEMASQHLSVIRTILDDAEPIGGVVRDTTMRTTPEERAKAEAELAAHYGNGGEA